MMSRKIQYTIPVLNSFACDDFPTSKFEGKMDVCIAEDKRVFLFTVEGLLHCATLEKYITEGVASIFVLVQCKKTRYRKMQRVVWNYSSKTEGTIFTGSFSVERTNVGGEIKATIVIIAQKEISNYCPSEANPDFFERETFHVPPGFLMGSSDLGKILLEDEDTKITGTDIMRIVSNPSPSCSMSVSYDEDIIRIELPEFGVQMRNLLLKKFTKTFRATICFPVLVEALSILQNLDENDPRAEFMWANVLCERLDLLGIDLKAEEGNLAGIANKLLGYICTESIEELSMYANTEEDNR